LDSERWGCVLLVWRALAARLNFAASDCGRSVYAIHFRADLFSLLPIGIYFSSINLRVTRSIASPSLTLLLVSRLFAEVSAPLSESERNHNNIRPK
jgi:hypothetical protein